MTTKAWGHALITGGSRGIGLALARELAPRCESVHLIARDERAVEAAAAHLRRDGHSAFAISADVRDLTKLVATIRDIHRRIGGLDLVVANAGVGASAPKAPSYAWEVVEAALTTNFLGAIATLTAVLPEMVASRKGHLVGVGSIASYAALPDSLSYCAPKAGLEMALACLALDTSGTGVDVSHVRLGFVATDMVKESTHWMPQLTSPEVAARAVVAELLGRPSEIVFPRALALAARGLGALPESVRKLIARRTRARS